MKNRLEAARELLRDDGAIFVSIDDREQSYLKVLMDEIFGRENFVNTFIKRTKIGGGSDATYGAVEHEYIIIFAKNKILLPEFFTEFDEDYLKRYKEEDQNWKYFWDTLARPGLKNPIKYDIILPDGTTTNQGWIWSKKRFDEEKEQWNIRIQQNKNGEWQIHFKQYLNIKWKRPRTLLTNLWGTSIGNKEIVDLFGKRVFAYPKSEETIQFIISLYTQPWDIVLDYHLGSGTTAAVAHKMGRRWIGVEQMDYIDTIAKERLKKVLDGEQGGISKNVNWQGGGDFVYLELKTFNGYFLDEIEKATSKETLKKIYNDMKRSAFLKFFFDPDDFENEESENGKKYAQLTLAEQKEKLKEVLDMNHIYLNAGNYDETVHTISELDKSLTAKFYGEK